MNQTDRIRQMEQRMEHVTAAIDLLYEAFDRYKHVQPEIKALRDYYDSDLWRQDFVADEADRLPKDLQRGVLSEDGLWNLLDVCREFDEIMQK